MPWVYILKCRDNSYYVGYCQDLDRRIAEHREGTYGGYTAIRLPVSVVFSQEFGTLAEAFRAERQLKGWSRAKKEAVIAGKHELLPELSRNRQGRVGEARGVGILRQAQDEEG